MLVVTVGLCVLLFISAYSDLVNPNTWIIPPFLGLGFCVVLALAVGWLIVMLVMGSWRNVLTLAVTLLLVSPPALRYFPLHLSGGPAPLTVTDRGEDIEHIQRIHLVSYNSCLMGQAKLGRIQEPIPVLESVREINPDVACIQEFSFSETKNSHTLEHIRSSMRDPFPYFDFTPYSYNNRSGIALLSKYPIRKADRIDHSKHDYVAAMYYQLEAEGRLIGLVNVHLRSNRFSKEDRLLYDEMLGHFEKDSLQRIRQGLGHSLAVAWRERATEVDKIADYIHANHPADMPLIICGDMNDTPVSYATRTLRDLGLSDTWSETGFGPGITYHEHHFLFRIDHILHSAQLRALRMKVRRDILHSDHYPVEATFQLLPQ